MSRKLLLVLIGIGGMVMDDGSNALYAQGAYPRVVGPTGRFYGPTQAHYQYQRQYGRPWHGGPAPYDPNTGVNVQVGGLGYPGYGGYAIYGGNVPFINSGYGYSIHREGFPLLGGFGLPGFGGGVNFYSNQFNYGAMPQYSVVPQVMVPQVGFGPVPMFNWQQPDAFQQEQLPQPQPQPQAPRPQANNAAQQPGIAGAVNPAFVPEPVAPRPHAFLPAQPSTVAQRQRSLHLQGQGDVWFRQQNYLQAYSRYRQAASAAPDQAAPRFRMAYALMTLQRYELAVPEMQRGIKLDPQYPSRGESLAQIYGEENRLAAAALPQAVASWVKQDIRSSDRLFLLGAFLMLNGDHVRARVLLETAAQFGAEGPIDHILAFLKADQPAMEGPAAIEAPPPADNVPPVPEAVEQMLKENKNWLSPPPPKKPAPQPKPAVVSPQPAANEADEPVAKASTTKPGYVPIPKKGESPQPVAVESPMEIQPAGVEAIEKESGPVIPIPNSPAP